VCLYALICCYTGISAGFMCVRGWTDYHHWNPSRVRCKVREYEHQPANWDFRGGDSSGDHVDIMGNRNMISDVLHIASGEDLEERIVSQIREMSARIILPESIR
jgi:phospholipid:diacylglycerol acyltransferase